MMVTQIHLIVTVVFFVATAPLLNADEEEDRAAKFAQMIKTIEAFTIKGGEAMDEELTLVMPPVLRYSDSVSSDIFAAIPDGAVFVWTRNGQPEALMSMHTGAPGQIWTEFLSLSSNPLVALRNERTIWSPKQCGAVYLPMRDAPEPSKTAPLRLVQMRSILDSFIASVSDQRGGRQELRLLAKPIFRYTQQEKGIIDGAIFVFARGTNPEMLVVLEARTDKENQHWVYSPVRYSGRQGEMRCPDERVWSHEQFTGARNSGDPFYQLNIDPEPLTRQK